jgi:hypothetical protein
MHVFIATAACSVCPICHITRIYTAQTDSTSSSQTLRQCQRQLPTACHSTAGTPSVLSSIAAAGPAAALSSLYAPVCFCFFAVALYRRGCPLYDSSMHVSAPRLIISDGALAAGQRQNTQYNSDVQSIRKCSTLRQKLPSVTAVIYDFST